MTTAESLRAELRELGLSTAGNKEMLKKRRYRARKGAGKSQSAHPPDAAPETEEWTPTTHTFLVTDVEATCESGQASGQASRYDYPNEIIELPVVLLRWNGQSRRYEETDRFHQYVRPVWRPQLSAFCMALTGVEQSATDGAQTWPSVLRSLFAWLASHGVVRRRRADDDPDEHILKDGVCWATHGPYDLASFVPKQSWIAAREWEDGGLVFGTRGTRGLPPLWLRAPVLDMRKAFCFLTRLAGPAGGTHAPSTHRRQNRRDLTVDGILAQLGMAFEGRPHSGIDDTHNIARILAAMAQWVRDGGGPERVPPCTPRAAAPASAPAPDHRGPHEMEQVVQALGNSHLSDDRALLSKSTAPERSGLPKSRSVRSGDMLPPLAVPPSVGEGALRANLNIDWGRWPWMGARPGEIHWPHPPDPHGP